jgi:hypothetical protein
MGLTIRFLKPCLCEGRCGDLVFHELFTQARSYPTPAGRRATSFPRSRRGLFAAISASPTLWCGATSSRASRPKRSRCCRGMASQHLDVILTRMPGGLVGSY